MKYSFSLCNWDFLTRAFVWRTQYSIMRSVEISDLEMLFFFFIVCVSRWELNNTLSPLTLSLCDVIILWWMWWWCDGGPCTREYKKIKGCLEIFSVLIKKIEVYKMFLVCFWDYLSSFFSCSQQLKKKKICIIILKPFYHFLNFWSAICSYRRYVPMEKIIFHSIDFTLSHSCVMMMTTARFRNKDGSPSCDTLRNSVN